MAFAPSHPLRRLTAVGLVAALGGLVPVLHRPARTPPPVAAAADSLVLDRAEVMIPMRDGVRLHTVLLRPHGMAGQLPLLMTRTPYGVAYADAGVRRSYAELARDGYVFVAQDIRGRFGSEGQFLMNRPLHDPKDSSGVDESTDTYDTIDWLVKNVPDNNGRVGVLGVSYPGFLAAMAGINHHPALKAISPQAPMTDTWIGDDFFHQGAFRLSYGFEYATQLELSKDMSVPPPVTRYDMYDWYLSQGPLSTLTRLAGDRVPTWQNFVRHPSYDGFWKVRALTKQMAAPEVPTLTVGGWWDQEDFYGPIASYAALEPRDTAHLSYVVLGPWNHGGWAHGEGDSLGRIAFRDSTARHFREKIQAPWFAYWLHDRGKLDLHEATVFAAGANEWRSFDSWPPKEAALRKLYLREQGGLAFDGPKGAGFDHYVSDPAHPVPYRQRPVSLTYDPRGSDWYNWLTQDQRFVENRPDVLTWQTGPLDHPVTIAGAIKAHLFAATTGSDADWVVKLIDVYPDSVGGSDPRMGGYQLMVASDILRGRYRTGFDHPTPITPNAVAEYVVDLHEQAYRFEPGHRIMVQVQSTWFPAYDRNPQTYVPNIFEARPSDFKAQTHRIYRSAGKASYVEVPVLKD
jgi:hypothetical protein